MSQSSSSIDRPPWRPAGRVARYSYTHYTGRRRRMTHGMQKAIYFYSTPLSSHPLHPHDGRSTGSPLSSLPATAAPPPPVTRAAPVSPTPADEAAVTAAADEDEDHSSQSSSEESDDSLAHSTKASSMSSSSLGRSISMFDAAQRDRVKGQFCRHCHCWHHLPEEEEEEEEEKSDEEEDESDTLYDPAKAVTLTEIPKNPIELRYHSDFLSEAECDQLIRMSQDVGFHRSAVGGSIVGARVSPIRTSYSSNISERNPLVVRIIDRARRMIGASRTGYAEVGIVRYEAGQQFKLHYDSGSFDREQTMFVYLNDVADGGETWFPRLRVKVKPAAGAAVSWRNLTHRDPTMPIKESMHAGLPVKSGVKFGMNIWFGF